MRSLAKLKTRPTFPGEASKIETLGEMARLAGAASVSPEIRAITVPLTADCLPYGHECRARRISRFISKSVNFIPDPRFRELITTPERHARAILQHGWTAGDCDDAAALTAAMLLSVGVPARFVAASYAPDRKLSHVWAEAWNNAGAWVECDPFKGERLAPTPTKSVALEIR